MRARFFLIFLVVFTIAMFSVKNGWSQGRITGSSTDYEFGKSIEFTANLNTDAPLQSALIYVQEENRTRTIVKPVNVTKRGLNDYQLEYSLDLNEEPIRAFAKISYYFEVALQSGEIITGPTEIITYIDDRFNWQKKQQYPFQVFWYEGDALFAQKILDVSNKGLERIKTLMPISLEQPVDIYVYPNAAEMQETLQLAGMSWVAGHADPDLGVIVVSLPPGPEQQLLTEQRIPHELMHILLYQSLGDGYSNLPAWLNEGLASQAELFPNPDYQALLENAYQKGRLFQTDLLCRNFPRDASGALLAYAQASSFVSFLHRSFGSEKLHNLVNEYADGVDCKIGLQNVYGISMNTLENQWREDLFGENFVRAAINKLLPWLVLMLAVLAVPLILIVTWLRRRPNKSQSRPMVE